ISRMTNARRACDSYVVTLQDGSQAFWKTDWMKCSPSRASSLYFTAYDLRVLDDHARRQVVFALLGLARQTERSQLAFQLRGCPRRGENPPRVRNHHRGQPDAAVGIKEFVRHLGDLWRPEVQAFNVDLHLVVREHLDLHLMIRIVILGYLAESLERIIEH